MTCSHIYNPFNTVGDYRISDAQRESAWRALQTWDHRPLPTAEQLEEIRRRAILVDDGIPPTAIVTDYTLP